MKKLLNKIYKFFIIVMIRISIVLSEVENNYLKSNVLDLYTKKEQVMIRKNPLLAKFLKGETDQQYVNDFYEVLKKADKFMREAKPHEIEMKANKFIPSYGRTDDEVKGKVGLGKDKFGKRYEHYGFFDSKHKNYGKTLAEAINDEVNERVTSDEDYEVEYMFSNKPVYDGLGSTKYLVEDDNSPTGYRLMTELEKMKARKFPLIVERDDDVANKIEQLAEYVHIRKFTEDIKIAEFLIPRKYNLHTFNDDHKIIKELLSFNYFAFKDEYNEQYWYANSGFRKRTTIIDESIKEKDIDNVIYDVLKINCTTIKKI